MATLKASRNDRIPISRDQLMLRRPLAVVYLAEDEAFGPG